MNSKFGSLWRKWDLHIHTDASDGKGTCEEILKEAAAKKISCIAVTDHHTVANIDIMKSLAEPMKIKVISGVEFRTEYGKASVHMIGLFPDEYNGTKLDADFLTENVLNPLGITRSKMILKGKETLKDDTKDDEIYFKTGMFQVQVNFKEAAHLIHKYGGLVTVHAGSKSNSIDEEMKHEGKAKKNVSIEDSLGPVKEELFNEGYIDICDITNPKEAIFYLKTFGKPSITTSDAHEVKEVGTKACWIKADLTFEGLKQILAEPERVSYDVPEILERIRKNPYKFIKGLQINRTSTATMPEKWFDNIDIPLNPGLVAVIGNKGSGKSALTDIVALCADTAIQNWSFLTPSKFRMAKPYNRSKQTEASIEWFDKSHSTIKTLDMSSDTTQPERVKYIPRNFLETLCTTEDDNQFESELKKIIFQYLEPAKRYGQNDLDSIINYLTKENTASCIGIQDMISKINKDIIDKEAMLDPEYKKKLANDLAFKQEQLSNAQTSKPKEVQKPSIEDNPEAQQSKLKIEQLQDACRQLELNIQSARDSREKLIRLIQDITVSKDKLIRLTMNIESEKNELKPLYAGIGLNIDDVLTIKFNKELIDSSIGKLSEQLAEIEQKLNETKEGSLVYVYKKTLEQLEVAKEKLSAPELEYQKYLKDKQEWEKMIEDIIGTPDKNDTIKFLQARIEYIERNLQMDLDQQKELRKQYVTELMLKKHEVLDIYNNLFAPIVKFIEEYKEDLKDYPIEFDASFAIRNFADRFFDFISQQASGSYYGKEQGALRIKENVESVEEDKIESFVHFACIVNDDLSKDKRDNQNSIRQIDSQLKKGHSKQELYDFIYGMDYVMPFFQLKMNGKPLSSLSPGERGALLLLLYLFIDMDDKPLIIDQPEENLDNESVFKYLVHFIKAAKKKRQIIMVTHNPNLAVVCDADQIIQMKIDKLHGNEVTYESGAIENPKINKIIVDILEGTYPAFHNRDCKYFDKSLKIKI
ncbi:TrlF family AAA-like ATPase [Prevotella sp.]|uniref:TrlF family AAA-like ATPase n=1 Tax=Prevotella sp. TaxID=59823 RepID=UPI003AB2F239